MVGCLTQNSQGRTVGTLRIPLRVIYAGRRWNALRKIVKEGRWLPYVYPYESYMRKDGGYLTYTLTSHICRKKSKIKLCLIYGPRRPRVFFRWDALRVIYAEGGMPYESYMRKKNTLCFFRWVPYVYPYESYMQEKK